MYVILDSANCHPTFLMKYIAKMDIFIFSILDLVHFPQQITPCSDVLSLQHQNSYGYDLQNLASKNSDLILDFAGLVDGGQNQQQRRMPTCNCTRDEMTTITEMYQGRRSATSARLLQ